MRRRDRRRNSLLLPGAIIAIAMLACAELFPSVGRCGNIFDDDWSSPPAIAEPGRLSTPPTVQPSSRPAPSDTGGPSSVTTPSSQSNSTPSGPQPVPAKPELTASRKLLKEAFAEQLRDHSAVARRKLTNDLIAEAGKESESASDRFVLLTGAITAALDAADLKACFEAIDLMAKSYAVDGLGLKTDAAMKMPLKSYQANVANNVGAGLEIMDELTSAEDFDASGRLAGLLGHAAATDSGLRMIVQKRVKNDEAVRAAHTRVRPAAEKLKSSPDDATANLALGSYYCFRAGNFPRGLPLLAKGSDSSLASVASAELRQPSDDEQWLKVADSWWDAAPAQPEYARPKIFKHAAAIYSRTLESTAGLKRTTVEKRINQADLSESNGSVNLLSITDPVRCSINASWKMQNHALSPLPIYHARLEFPYVPPEEYDYRLSYVATTPHEGFEIICSAQGHQFGWSIGNYENTITGFELIKGQGVKGNKTMSLAKEWITPGQRYTAVVKVRRNGVQAYLNDRLVAAWKTDYSDMSLIADYKLKNPDTIGIISHNAVIQFDAAEVVEVSGPGRPIR